MRRACFLSAVLAASISSAYAEDDVKTLLKDLNNQIKELRAQVKESNARINELEQSLAQEKDRQLTHQLPKDSVTESGRTAVAAEAAVTAEQARAASNVVSTGDVKGTIKLAGSNTSIGFGGFTKLHMMYTDVSIPKDKWGHQEFYGSDIPVGERHQSGQFNAQAKESRLWFKSFTPSALGDINTLIEVDLDQSASTYTPRLRHAYGSIGNFLAGQTYTTFTNTSALAEIDAAIAVGNIVVRQPLVRWTQPIPDTAMDVMVAMEFPSSRFTRSSSAAASIENVDDERFPDMVLRLNTRQDWGNISLSGMAREIRYRDAAKGIDEHAWGSAISLAGRINIGNRDNARFMFSYGDVLGRYIVGGTYADASFDEVSNELKLNTTYSGTLFYQHYWNPTWRSNLALGYSRTDLPAYVNQALTREVSSANINLMWSPLTEFTLGLEYLYAVRELEDGRRGDMNRILLSTRFNF